MEKKERERQNGKKMMRQENYKRPSLSDVYNIVQYNFVLCSDASPRVSEQKDYTGEKSDLS